MLNCRWIESAVDNKVFADDNKMAGSVTEEWSLSDTYIETNRSKTVGTKMSKGFRSTGYS